MSTIRNKTRKPTPSSRNKTKKSNVPSRNNAIKAMYNKDYYGTTLLPMTDILNYTNNNFDEFVIYKERKLAETGHEVDSADFFIIDDIFKKKEKTSNINIIIKKNPVISLKKMLAYSLYTKSFPWFNNGIMNISSFKYQIGKDVSRTDIKINNEKYVIQYPADGSRNYNKIADDFNIKIMNVLSTFSIIDFDLVNKIGILMCQNVFNFTTDLITFMIMKKIEPEMSSDMEANKDILINLTQNEQSIIFNFESQLTITYNKEFNVQKKCGASNFSLLVDLKKNIYKFTKFILNYNVEGCKPDDNKKQINNNENKGTSDIIKYGIPMGILATGLVGTPFLLGALGGNHNKKLKIKSRKMRKMRKIKRIKRQSKKYF
jgi:cell division protein ZapA (FtsZ GTPase activity inhibitor)